MADDIAGQLLGLEERASWCGDTDPTGRYVCQRIRNHALDWHECRNDKGGRHMWKVAVDPVDLPFGALLRDPKSGRWAVRFQVDDTTGKGMHAWLVPPTTDHPEVRVLHHVEVRGWQPFEIIIDQVNRLEGERDGILTQLVRLAKEFERVRASREAWAVEADRLDAQVEELTRERDDARQVENAVAKATGLPAKFADTKNLLHAVSWLLRQVDEARAATRHESFMRQYEKNQPPQHDDKSARPAIPADAGERIKGLRLGLGPLDGIEQAVIREIESWSAPVSGSGTTVSGCPACATGGEHTFGGIGQFHASSAAVLGEAAEAAKAAGSDTGADGDIQ